MIVDFMAYLIPIVVTENLRKRIRQFGLIAGVSTFILFTSLPTYSDEATAPECTHYEINLQDIAKEKNTRVDSSPFVNLQGKTIRNIHFRQLNIFDENNPRENNGVYMFLNKLHIKTRPNVVSAQLLFKEGDAISSPLMDETVRNLRTRHYFTDAYILPEQVCGNDVDVVVITQDSWALEPQLSFSRKSSHNQSGFGISDGNILGTGNAFTVGYLSSQARNTVSYDFSNPYFLNKQIALHVLYEDTSDGRNSLVDIAHPFNSLDTPWASGLQLSNLALTEEIRSHGKVVNEFDHKTVFNQIYVGSATNINAGFTERWLVGFSEEEESFFPTSNTLSTIPAHDQARYPWVEYQYIENKFGVFKNVNQIQRPEDIALGKTFIFRFGVAGKSLSNVDDVVRYQMNYSNIFDLAEKHIVEYEVKIDGREHLSVENLDPAILTSNISYNYFQDDQNRWYTKLEYSVGKSLAQYQELTVGDITGLRGYPTDYLRGTKRYVVTVERRYFSEMHLFNLMRLGGVIFFDAGKAWGLQNDNDSPLLSDVGIGFRLSSTKVKIGNVVHVDLAMPTSFKSGISKYQLTIGAEQQF